VPDLTPLRRSHDLRCLFAGQLASTLGSQLTTVAVPAAAGGRQEQSARPLPAFTHQRAPAAPHGAEPASVAGAAS
jgi:hypothetical protein